MGALQQPSERDEVIDFMRGFACISFITAHFEPFNWLDLVFWERLGIFSGAELFVMLSGLLIGMVHRTESATSAWISDSTARLYGRAFQLYRAYVCAVLIVLVIDRSGWLETKAITSFTDYGAAKTYWLMPPADEPTLAQLGDVLMLRYSPHQIQILGLYIFLLLSTPPVLMALKRSWDWAVVATSIGVWIWNHYAAMMPTGAQFEYAFPLLSWQVYFFCALVLGYRRREVEHWAREHPSLGGALLASCGMIAAASFLFAQTTSNPAFPPGTRLPLIRPETFRAVYNYAFLKNSVGWARVLSSAAFAVCCYQFVSHFWIPARRAFGWLLLPMGRTSLYVFLVHLAFLVAVEQLPGHFDRQPSFDPSAVWINTAVLVAIIAAIWVMLRFRILFSIIPR
jgi:hypothetical protein